MFGGSDEETPMQGRANIWPCASFGAAGMGIAPSTMRGIRTRAADAVCPKSGRCVTSFRCIWARAATHWDGVGLEKGRNVSVIKQHLRFFEKRDNHAMYGALLTAATGACWPKARVAGLSPVALVESCVRCGAVRDDSFHQIWSCPVTNAIPHDNIRKSQHPFQRANCGWRCLWQGMWSNHA